MGDVREALAFALQKYPQRLIVNGLRDLVSESARQNDKRPAFVKLDVPDEVVKGLRGAPEVDRSDLVVVVVVPREVLDRMGSRIVLPGE